MELSRQSVKGEHKKYVISGIQGSGKTYLSQWISSLYHTVHVYTPHWQEWEKIDVTVFKPTDYVDDFQFWLKIMKRGRGKIDCLIIDEADMLFRSHFDSSPDLRDLVINHRHYGISLVFITRRPQNIPTWIFEQCEYVATFKMEGVNVVKKFGDLDHRIPDLMDRIRYENHEFVIKKLGKPPVIAKIQDKRLVEVR